MPKLIVGLGNTGSDYEKTRHNVGFFVVDRLAEIQNIDLSRSKFKAKFGEFFAESGEKVILLKPQTMMNLSGEAVGPWMEFLKIPGQDVLVIYDELDLPLGRLRGQWGGGSGGHNGIRSIAACLGHPDFCRLRIGIGRPALKTQVTGYVLSNFAKQESAQVEEFVDRAAEACQLFIKLGLDPMMQMVNKKPS